MRALGHAEAHEIIADLALEPAALRALASEGSPEATSPGHAPADPTGNRPAMTLDDETREALRAHLAACPDCRADVEAWAATHAKIDDAVAAAADGRSSVAAIAAERPIAAPPELRARIAAALGSTPNADALERAGAGVAPRPAARDVGPEADDDLGPAPTPRPVSPGRIRLGLAVSWRRYLPLAAALAIVVGAVGVVRDQMNRTDAARAEVAALASLGTVVDRVLADPSRRVVTLTSADGSPRGTLAWSRHDLVVLTSALAEPPPGKEYRCWVERDGTRTRVGSMWFVGGLAYWSGSLDEWATISFDGGGRFGVSLESVGGTGGSSPVLTGDLGA